MKRAVGICRNERQIDVTAGHTGKLDLSLLCGFLQSLKHHLVIAKINSVLRLKFVCHPVDHSLVEVIAAQLVVTCRCKNFEHAVRDLKKRYIEGTAAKVKYHDLLIVFLIHTVGKSCRGRLIDDSLNIKSRNFTGILSCLSLGIREICGNRNNSLGHSGAKICLGIGFELLKNHCGNFLRSVILSVNRGLEIGTHFALNTADRAIGVCDSLTLCHLTNHALTCLCEGNDGGGGASTFGIGDDDRLAALKNRNARICCSQIYSDNFSHDCISS